MGSRLLPFDHIHPLPSSRLKSPYHTAVLYVLVESDSFRPLHETLLAASSKNGALVQYVIRYIPPSNPATTRNYLSGYGVAMDLKKTDYLALDDRRASSGVGEGKTGNHSVTPTGSFTRTYGFEGRQGEWRSGSSKGGSG
jgi:UDP-glucose:glycoprotein glucosyltransferase